MSFQPRLSLPRNTRQSDTGVAFIFKSPDRILDALDHVFGSRQQDAHVKAHRHHLHMLDWEMRSKRAAAAVAEYAQEMILRARAEREARR